MSAHVPLCEYQYCWFNVPTTIADTIHVAACTLLNVDVCQEALFAQMVQKRDEHINVLMVDQDKLTAANAALSTDNWGRHSACS